MKLLYFLIHRLQLFVMPCCKDILYLSFLPQPHYLEVYFGLCIVLSA